MTESFQIPHDPDPKFQPTPASEFKRSRRGFNYTLPSTGRRVVMRAIPLVRFLMRGEIPEDLVNLTAAVIWGAGDNTRDLSIQQLALETQNLTDWVAKESLIAPRIVDADDGDDEILITDLTTEEIRDIYDAATAPARALYPFRDQQESDVAPLSNGDAIQPRPV